MILVDTNVVADLLIQGHHSPSPHRLANAAATPFSALPFRLSGIRLAPFYDIVCTEAYPNLDHSLSMNFGTTRHVPTITFADIERFAKDVSVGRQLVLEEIAGVTKTITESLQSVLDEAGKTVGSDPMLQKLHDVMTRRTRSLRNAAVR